MTMKLTSKTCTPVLSLTRAFSNMSIVRDISKAPKRPATSFANYVKEQLEGSLERKTPIKQLMVDLGQAWKELDPKKKQPYISKFESDIAKYNEEMEAFKANLGPEGLKEFINKKNEARQAKKEKALKKLHKAQRDPNMPKRPISSFFRFCKEFRTENPSQLPQNIIEQSQYLSKLWKEMPQSKKQTYIDEYEVEAKKHLKAMEEYNEKNNKH